MKTTVSAAALLAALLVAPAIAQQDTQAQDTRAQDTTGAIGAYSAFDANSDRQLTEDEFRPFVDQTYEAWDTNANDLLEEDEIWRGVHGYWDADRDRIVVQDEFERGYASWFNDLEPREEAFGVGEGMDAETFAQAAGEGGLYPDWSIGEEGMDRERFGESLWRAFGGEEGSVDEARFEELTGGDAS